MAVTPCDVDGHRWIWHGQRRAQVELGRLGEVQDFKAQTLNALVAASLGTGSVGKLHLGAAAIRDGNTVVLIQPREGAIQNQCKINVKHGKAAHHKKAA